MKSLKLILGLGAAMLVFALVFVCWHRAILTCMATWLDVSEKPQPCDLVMLLNGDINTRPFVAAALVRHGWAPRLAFAKCYRTPAETEGIVPMNEEANLRIIEYCGVARDKVVVLAGEASTTFDEVQALALYLDKNPLRRIAVVTEGPHTRRSRWIVEQVLGRRVEQIVMVAAPIDDFQAGNWWHNESGVLFIVTEYAKLVFYWFRYGLFAYELIAVAAVVGLLLVAWRRHRIVLGTFSGRNTVPV